LEPQEVNVKKQGNLWSIVLAGGDGSRLSQIAIGSEGRPIPKQFCSVNGGPSLIRQALRRARAVAGPDRTMVVVAAEHRRWWSLELADLPSVKVVVQPCNRGTACGVLLPLMQVIARDPDATVVVLPSDHVVADEPTLFASINAAVEHIDREPDRLVLLGFEPDGPDTGFGWIAPRSRSGDRISAVAQFVEKPDQHHAEELVREGALWNSFIFAMRAEELFALFQWALPWLTRMFDYAMVESTAGPQAARVAQLYERLPAVDFSRAVLEEAGPDMRVVAVPPCGWTDVGTPEGIARCAKGCSSHVESRSEAPTAALAPVDLADALGAYLDRAERERGEPSVSRVAD
jgi:mannose-1-phosphate guanylyltransferase